jgi:hypothetical protein
MTHDDAPVDIGRLLDDGRWGGYQRWLVFLTALTIVFDGIDNQLLGIVIPTLMREWGAPRSAFAPIVSLGYHGSASFFGLIAGAMCATFVALALVRRHVPASGNR